MQEFGLAPGEVARLLGTWVYGNTVGLNVEIDLDNLYDTEQTSDGIPDDMGERGKRRITIPITTAAGGPMATYAPMHGFALRRSLRMAVTGSGGQVRVTIWFTRSPGEMDWQAYLRDRRDLNIVTPERSPGEDFYRARDRRRPR